MEIKRAFTANEKASLPAENGAANCGRSLLPALPNVPPARSCSPLLCPYQTGVCAKGSRNNNFAVAVVSHRPRGVDTSVDAARTSAQCRLVLPLADTSLNCEADALVCSRPPGRLFVSGKHLIPRANSGSRGTAQT